MTSTDGTGGRRGERPGSAAGAEAGDRNSRLGRLIAEGRIAPPSRAGALQDPPAAPTPLDVDGEPGTLTDALLSERESDSR